MKISRRVWYVVTVKSTRDVHVRAFGSADEAADVYESEALKGYPVAINSEWVDFEEAVNNQGWLTSEQLRVIGKPKAVDIDE